MTAAAGAAIVLYFLVQAIALVMIPLGLPGTFLQVASAAVLAIVSNGTLIGWRWVSVFLVLALLGELVEFLSGQWGAGVVRVVPWTRGRCRSIHLDLMRALAVAAFLAMVRVTLAANATLESAEVSAAPDLAVELDLSAPVAAHGQALRADGDLPDRVFIDLPATVVGARVPKVLTGTGPLLRVRIAQRDPSTVRVVLDLARPTPYAVRTVSRSVVISLGSPPPSTPPEPTATRSNP